jgi:hypothetical protein
MAHLLCAATKYEGGGANMPFSLLPKAIFHKLTDVTPEFLRARGVRLLMLDFDNTMLPYTSKIPTEELLTWIDGMKRDGVELCVVSNSKKAKAAGFCKAHNIACITHSKKPGRRGIRQCLARFDAEAQESALAGDQIFTDVLGANRAGALSILVKPIHLHNIWLKLRHAAEQPFIYLARKRRITKP